MRLKEIRIEKGLSQKAVANSLECSPTVYSRYETGERQPSIEMLIKLSEFFEVSVDYLIGHYSFTAHNYSEFEEELVRASRNADDRARMDALSILKQHCIND